MVRFACVDGRPCCTVGWLSGCMVGRSRLLDDDIGVLRGVSEKYRVVVDVASLWHFALVDIVVGRVRAFERHRTAGLLDMVFETWN